jgi:hypothetical protein
MAATYLTHLIRKSTAARWSAETTLVKTEDFDGYHISLYPSMSDNAVKKLQKYGCTVVNGSVILVNNEIAESLDTGEAYNRAEVDLVWSPVGEPHPEDEATGRGLNVARLAMRTALSY